MTPQHNELISVVFSFRNEVDVLPVLIGRLHDTLKGTGHDYEFVFVNDQSTDGSRELLMDLAKEDSHIRIVNMSSRFGISPCFLAGMKYARGDIIITLDCDLQDPPEIIPQMIEKWREGADVVYGTRTNRPGESAFKMFVTKWAYRILHEVSEVDLPVDTGMYRLMTRRVVETILSIDERDPFLRGLVSWVGYRQEQIYYAREKRPAGGTHFPLFSKAPAKEFVIGMISYSQLPLVFIVVLGFFTGAATLVALVGFIAARMSGTTIPVLYAGIGVLAFLMSCQLLVSAVLWLYLARIYNQVRSRPEYIVESTHGFPPENQ